MGVFQNCTAFRFSLSDIAPERWENQIEQQEKFHFKFHIWKCFRHEDTIQVHTIFSQQKSVKRGNHLSRSSRCFWGEIHLHRSIFIYSFSIFSTRIMSIFRMKFRPARGKRVYRLWKKMLFFFDNQKDVNRENAECVPHEQLSAQLFILIRFEFSLEKQHFCYKTFFACIRREFSLFIQLHRDISTSLGKLFLFISSIQ